MTMWMIVWVQLMTGQTGHGECMMDKAELEYQAEAANAHFEGVYWHWVEPCQEDI
jgi:hypothetical protein